MKSLLMAFAVVAVAFEVRSERIELSDGNARCVVDTLGGRLISYSVGGEEALWYPEREDDSPDALWRHGGIPLAWPWYGRLGNGEANIHGYVWKNQMKVVSRTQNALTLAFETESARLEYAIRLGEVLQLSLRTVNKSAYDFPFTVAFHPYFRVGERDRVLIEGMEAQPIPCTNAVDAGVNFGGPLPRRDLLVRDGALRRVLRITAEDATGANLWNPGVEKDCPGVIPGDEWRRFVAVEPYVKGAYRMWVLRPGEENVLKMSVRIERDKAAK